MEGVVGVPTEPFRVGQRTDHVKKFDHRARPAMGQDQRPRVAMRGAYMQKVDTQITDGRAELRISVEPVGDPVHVVVARPVAGQLAHIIPRDALGPVGHGFAIWPSCPLQASAQIGDVGLGNFNTKVANFDHGDKAPFNSVNEYLLIP